MQRQSAGGPSDKGDIGAAFGNWGNRVGSDGAGDGPHQPMRRRIESPCHGMKSCGLAGEAVQGTQRQGMVINQGVVMTHRIGNRQDEIVIEQTLESTGQSGGPEPALRSVARPTLADDPEAG